MISFWDRNSQEWLKIFVEYQYFIDNCQGIKEAIEALNQKL